MSQPQEDEPIRMDITQWNRMVLVPLVLVVTFGLVAFLIVSLVIW